jgi:hypothetical protein
VLLGFIILQEAKHIASRRFAIDAAATLQTVLVFAVGFGTGWARHIGATDRFTVGMIFVVRNVGIAGALLSRS